MSGAVFAQILDSPDDRERLGTVVAYFHPQGFLPPVDEQAVTASPQTQAVADTAHEMEAAALRALEIAADL